MPAMQIVSKMDTDTQICGLKSWSYWNNFGCLGSSKEV